jgi:hypothetical protein
MSQLLVFRLNFIQLLRQLLVCFQNIFPTLRVTS